jgi:hypothetical protein
MMRDEEGCGGTKDHSGECASDAARQPGTVQVGGHAESPSVINSNLATPVWFQRHTVTVRRRRTSQRIALTLPR